jgi:hypothetical protein
MRQSGLTTDPSGRASDPTSGPSGPSGADGCTAAGAGGSTPRARDRIYLIMALLVVATFLAAHIFS